MIKIWLVMKQNGVEIIEYHVTVADAIAFINMGKKKERKDNE